MIKRIRGTGVIDSVIFKNPRFCMFWWHWAKTLPSGDQSFRALVRERAGWERVERGIGRSNFFGQRLFYMRTRWLMLSVRALYGVKTSHSALAVRNLPPKSGDAVASKKVLAGKARRWDHSSLGRCLTRVGPCNAMSRKISRAVRPQAAHIISPPSAKVLTICSRVGSLSAKSTLARVVRPR